MIKGSIGVMKERNKTGDFTAGIKKEEELLQHYIQEYKQ
jgi:hypothetical protein